MTGRGIKLHGRAVAVLVASALAAGVAFAGGSYGPAPVKITPRGTGGGYAEGALGYVRNTANDVEFIACSVRRAEALNADNAPTAQVTDVSCSARDAAGTLVSCSSNSNDIARMLNAVSGDAILGFNYEANGSCSSVIVYESSSLVNKL